MKKTNKLLMAIFFALLMVVTACNDDTIKSPETQDIDGIITNAGGQAIANATVSALDIEDVVLAIDTTNAEGYFLLSKLPDNLENIDIMVVKSGYNSYRTDITNIKSQNEGSLPSIQMTESKDDTCCKGILYLYPKNKATNETILKGIAKLWKNGKLIEVVEFKEGVAAFDGICEGSYGISVFAEGYKLMEFTYEHPCNETVEKTALMEQSEESDCCGLITVCVREKGTDAIINDVEIRLNKGDDIIAKKYTNSKDACVTFENICEGKYWIRIYHADYEVIETDFNLGECDTIEIDKLIVKKETEKDTCCTASLKVKVKDKEKSEYVKDMPVYLLQGGKVIREGKTNADGYYVFKDLCAPGEYKAMVYESEKYKSNYFEIKFTECKDLQETLWITPKETEEDTCCTASLKVKVKDAEKSEYVKDMPVYLLKDGKVIREANTNADGYYIFKDLCAPGEYKAMVYESEKYKSNYFEIKFTECKDLQETLWITPKETEKDTCCKGILYIYPKDSETKEAIKNGTVKIWKNGQLLETLTVKEGKAVIDGLCEGKYGVDIYSEGYKTIEFEYEHPCNQTIEKTKYLEKK